MNLSDLVRKYGLHHELRERSMRQIDAIVSVYLTWAGQPELPVEEFTADSISQFLADKQRAGRSSFYRRSLRNTLKALYRFARGNLPCEPIRPVKLDTLEPESWSTEEVDRLIGAVDSMRLTVQERWRWRTLIGVAYSTGLNACDLHRLERRDIGPTGIIVTHRSKTGKRVTVQVPMELVAEIDEQAPADGPIWPCYRSEEAERMQFRRLVKHAGIRPLSFRALRKTAGTLIESAAPNRGHEALGNSREIFDRHYADRRVLAPAPVMPTVLRAFGGA